jgi:hypothetical protein
MQTNNVVLERWGAYDEEQSKILLSVTDNKGNYYIVIPKEQMMEEESKRIFLGKRYFGYLENGVFHQNKANKNKKITINYSPVPADPIKRIGELLDKNIDNMKGFQKCIQKINIESQLKQIKADCLLSHAIVNNLGKYPLETIIGDIKDFAKDNYKMTEQIVGKDLLKTIINF